MAFGQQPVLQLAVVLDDPVVDQRQLAGAIGVGMGVDVVRAAVGGPAGVGDARVAGRRATVELLGEVAELAGLFLHEDVTGIGQQRDARRVIAAVLQAAQPVQQDGRRVTRADVTDDAAHERLLS